LPRQHAARAEGTVAGGGPRASVRTRAGTRDPAHLVEPGAFARIALPLPRTGRTARRRRARARGVPALLARRAAGYVRRAGRAQRAAAQQVALTRATPGANRARQS